MPITTLKTEDTDVRLLVKRLYPGLDEIAWEKIETAVRKENPHLAEIEGLRPGVVIKVPRIPGITGRAEAENDTPIEVIQEALLEAVKEFKMDTMQHLATLAGKIGDQRKVLQENQIRQVIDKQGQEAKDLGKQLAATLTARTKDLDLEKKQQNTVVAKILDDLKSLSQWG
jgi:hypothetical protein